MSRLEELRKRFAVGTEVVVGTRIPEPGSYPRVWNDMRPFFSGMKLKVLAFHVSKVAPGQVIVQLNTAEHGTGATNHWFNVDWLSPANAEKLKVSVDPSMFNRPKINLVRSSIEEQVVSRLVDLVASNSSKLEEERKLEEQRIRTVKAIIQEEKARKEQEQRQQEQQIRNAVLEAKRDHAAFHNKDDLKWLDEEEGSIFDEDTVKIPREEMDRAAKELDEKMRSKETASESDEPGFGSVFGGVLATTFALALTKRVAAQRKAKRLESQTEEQVHEQEEKFTV